MKIIICVRHIVFKEIVKSVAHVLRKKGYTIRFQNHPTPGDPNLHFIILGNGEKLRHVPKRYIVYNFEQTNIPENNAFTPYYLDILRKAESVWDYSLDNCRWLRHKYRLRNVQHVALLHCPVLSDCRIIKDSEKTVDVIFIGSITPRRKIILDQLQNYCNVELANFTYWGQDRASLISNAKIVINIHAFNQGLLETARLSYLLSNNSFVVTENGREKGLRSEYSQYAILTNYDQLIDEVKYYLSQPQKRIQKKKAFIQAWKTTDYSTQFLFLPNVPQPEHVTPKKKKRMRKKEGKLTYVIPREIETVDVVKLDNGGCRVPLPFISDEDLPYVSILTPTKNRRHLFPIALYNFAHFVYPREKLEWVIIDNGEEDIQDLLPSNANIKYMKLDQTQTYTIGQLRNICVQEASHDILLHMDDDDYYTPESVLARVKSLIKYKSEGVQCVGSVGIGCFDIVYNKSTDASNGITFLPEATLGYTREFWNERHFDNESTVAEFNEFLNGRQTKIRSIPFQFIIVALTHHRNMTGNLRRQKLPDAKEDQFDYSTLFPPDFKRLIHKLKFIHKE